MGQRLAYLALNKDYNIEGLPGESPQYKEMTVDKNKAVISFTNLGKNEDLSAENSFNGFTDEGTMRLEGFEIAGDDQIFYPANANLVWWQNKIEVTSDEVPEPKAVRYGFKNFPKANVNTVMNLPLAPFRTDNWVIPANEIYR